MGAGVCCNCERHLDRGIHLHEGAGGLLCRACYVRDFQPRHRCAGCDRSLPTSMWIGGASYCGTCYKRELLQAVCANCRCRRLRRRDEIALRQRRIRVAAWIECRKKTRTVGLRRITARFELACERDPAASRSQGSHLFDHARAPSRSTRTCRIRLAKALNTKAKPGRGYGPRRAAAFFFARRLIRSASLTFSVSYVRPSSPDLISQ